MDMSRKTNGESVQLQRMEPSVAQSSDHLQVTQSSNGSAISNTTCINCSSEPRRPLLLPCLHILCASCVACLESINDKTITCPKCQHVGLRSDVVENAQLGSSMVNAKTEGWQPCSGCSEDRSVEGEHFCIDCQEYLCEDCRLAHLRVKITKHHTFEVKPKTTTKIHSEADPDDGFWCSVHCGEALQLYCETCAQLTCRDCQLSSKHMDHTYQFISDAAATGREHLSRLLSRLKDKTKYVEISTTLIERRRMDILVKEQSVVKAIKSFQLQLMREINKKGNEMMNDLKQTCVAKLHQVSQKHREIETLASSLSHCLVFAENTLKCTNDAAFLNCKRALAQRLSAMLDERCQVPNPNHVIDLRFKENSSLVHAISKLGVLINDGKAVTSTPTLLTNNLVNGTIGAQSTNNSSPSRTSVPTSATDWANLKVSPPAYGPNSALMRTIVGLNSIGTHGKLELLQNMQQLLRSSMELQDDASSSVSVSSGSQKSSLTAASVISNVHRPTGVANNRTNTIGSAAARNLPIATLPVARNLPIATLPVSVGACAARNLPIVTLPVSGRGLSYSVRSTATNDSNTSVQKSGYSTVSGVTVKSVPFATQGRAVNNEDNDSETNVPVNFDVAANLLITIEPTDANYSHDNSPDRKPNTLESSIVPLMAVSQFDGSLRYRPVNTLMSGINNASQITCAARTNNSPVSGNINSINQTGRVIPASKLIANSANNSVSGRVLAKRLQCISIEATGATDAFNNEEALEVKRHRAAESSDSLLDPDEIKQETETTHDYASRGQLQQGRVLGVAVSSRTQDTLRVQNHNPLAQHSRHIVLQPLNSFSSNKNSPLLALRSTMYHDPMSSSSDQINSQDIVTLSSYPDIKVPLGIVSELANHDYVLPRVVGHVVSVGEEDFKPPVLHDDSFKP